MLQELPRDVGIALREGAKVPKLDRVAPKVRLRRHRRRPGSLADQRELSEVIARPELRDLGSIDTDGRLSLDDHEAADTAHLALPDDRETGAELPLAEVFRKLLQLTLAEVGKEGDMPQLAYHACHRASITGLRHSTAGTRSRRTPPARGGPAPAARAS